MNKILEQVNSGDDVKKLDVDQLAELSEGIRSYILDTISCSGGHLGSNLGAVEATVAMHYVFDFAKDKLLWDVGHQCYTHKILTGRKEAFKNLRQASGVSGFPNPDESDCDQFKVGHAGSAIATAIGMALGEYKNKQDNKIIAFVGDASIVNGVSFEALNNMHLVKRQLLIVLNDNSMAIDATAGAIAKYMSKIRLSHTYEDMRKMTNRILESVPVIGRGVEDAIEGVKRSIRMTMPSGRIFESLNIPYFGLIDAHDTVSLVKLFKMLGEIDHPAILHICSNKGKGFIHADDEPSKFHSTAPFKVNGDKIEIAASARSFTSAFGDSLVELAKEDGRVVAITSAMTGGTGLSKFKEEFKDRFYDVGIAESAAIDIAAGLAKTGAKPVVCIYSTFLQRGFDQIFQEVSLQNLGVIFCIDRAGLVGADGSTHHGLLDIGFLRMMPNMVLCAPTDEAEMKSALKFAAGHNGPVAIRYPKDEITQGCDATSEGFEIGKSVVVRKSKSAEVAIIAYGAILAEARKAADKLAEMKIEVEVVNARFAAPIDDYLVELCGTKKGIITIEEASIDCGFGSAVLERVSQNSRNDDFCAKITTLGVPRRFIKHDTRVNQLIDAGINADKIVQAATEIIDR